MGGRCRHAAIQEGNWLERIGEIISRVMTREGYEKRSRQGPIYDLWPQMVGELLAEKCRPIAIQKGVLVVQVDDSVWMHELQIQKYQILERLWELVGEEEVSDIRWTAKGYRPPRPRHSPRSLSPKRPPRPLTQEEGAWIEAVAAQVEDGELGNIVRRVLMRYLRAGQRGEDRLTGPPDSPGSSCRP